MDIPDTTILRRYLQAVIGDPIRLPDIVHSLAHLAQGA